MNHSIYANADASNVSHGTFRPTLLSRLLSTAKSWRNRRIAIRELHAMPDSLLCDIGIARWQIEDAVNRRSADGAQPTIHRLHDNNVAVPVEQESVGHKATEHKQAA